MFLQKFWGNWISCGEAAVSKLGWHRDIARQHQGQNSGEASCSSGVIRNLRNSQWTEFISQFDSPFTTKSHTHPKQLCILVAPSLITENLHVFLVGIYNWMLYSSFFFFFCTVLTFLISVSCFVHYSVSLHSPPLSLNKGRNSANQ